MSFLEPEILVTVIAESPTIVKVTPASPTLVTTGTPGPQGPPGHSIWNGSGAPADSLGYSGDFYIDTSGELLYGPKSNTGVWPTPGVSLVGPRGPVGPAGGTTFTYTQSTPASFARIVHNLGRNPQVTLTLFDGDVVEGDIDYLDVNTLTVTFSQPFSWIAYME